VQTLQLANQRIAVHSPSAYPHIVDAINSNGEIKAVVSFGALSKSCVKPTLSQLAEKGSRSITGDSTVYRYADVKSALFVIPGHKDFDPASSVVAHSRSVEFLKKHLGGPYFDLEGIWEEHTKFEFTTRNVEDTMATMVKEPYVNHIPTMTGGIGRDKLAHFYRNHFIFNNPDDTDLQLVSRTVGTDRVIDEFVYTCTHTREIDWL
jgi:carboxymethylenebutenolidase